jgi:ribonuclease HI
MKPTKSLLPTLAVSSALLMAATLALAASTTRYLHVRVSNPTTHELVRVNVPLALAEKVIPAINHGELRDGKVRIGNFTADNVNVRAILDALKTAPEGEFVTVQNTGDDVRVAKEHGQMVVHVIDKNSHENVDVTVPWDVVQALISDTTENQLNVEAAIKALENVGDTTLVRVSGHDENVRVWVDSQSDDSRNTDSE